MKKIFKQKICVVTFFCVLSIVDKNFFSKPVYAQLNQDLTNIENQEKKVVESSLSSRALQELSIVPIIQKIPVDGTISQNVGSLFQNINGMGLKLKDEIVVDTSKIGFQWVEVSLLDASLTEYTCSVPINVYNPKTTTLDDSSKLAIDVEEHEISYDDFQEAMKQGTINQFIIKKLNITSWSLIDGFEIPIEVDTSSVNLLEGLQNVTIKSRNPKNRASSIQKKIQLKITKAQEDGWTAGTASSSVGINGVQISWYDGLWWYTYNSKSWMYQYSIEAALIINGNFILGTSDDVNSGFLKSGLNVSTYAVNRQTNSLKRTFKYLNKYKIDIIQQILKNNAVEVTYQVTNLGFETEKIGLSQYVDVFVGSDSVPVTPINNFKGINLTYGESSLAILPDPKSFPNWSAGYFSQTARFEQYNVQNANGIGWETGSRYRSIMGGLLTPPEVLKENVAISLGDSALSMKNPGVNVLPGESTAFKQTLKYGKFSKPEVTIEQNKGDMYQDEEIGLSGTIVAKDNQNYRLYLELDDEKKTLIPLKEYTNIPYGQKQAFNVKIKGELFKAGVHTVSIIGIDEYGSRSEPQKLNLTINELSATPVIQKVKTGEQLTDDIATLFKDIKGTNIILKNKPVLDSTKVGFSWAEVTLEAIKGKEIQLKIPVNIYDPISTVYDEKMNIMLDVKDSRFSPKDVKTAEASNGLNELIVKAAQPKSWNMDTGLENEVMLTSTNLTAEFGTYTGIFVAQNKETQATIQKEAKLSVGGELKFKAVPNRLLFSSSKLSQKETYVTREDSAWGIDIENTISASWSLFISGSPLTNQTGEAMKNSLIFKDSDTKDQPINENLQKIVIGEKKVSYPKVQWKANEGPLIKMNQGLKIGEYTGELYWTLSDAP